MNDIMRRFGTAHLIILFGVAAMGLPWLFPQEFVLSTLSSMGIAIILALSYNMLYGQAGMLSFGHAVYSGLGAYCTIHALGAINAGFTFPITLLPLVGGIAGLVFGVLFGYLSTKRAGTPFAMITLGLSELVSACAYMMPRFFGGELGISANRTAGGLSWGAAYGTQAQVYYLIAGWMLVSMLAMYAFSRTPLGMIASALRDNAERVRFVGYDAHAIRFRVHLAASFFAGIAGALSAINYEIVTIDSMGVAASGMVMLMTVIGGAGSFFGPVLGAIIVTLLQTTVSAYTHAWPFYFGLLFLVVIYCAPEGLASLVSLHKPVWTAKSLARLLPSYGAALISGLIVLAGIVAAVEAIYRFSDNVAANMLVLYGTVFSPVSAATWIFSAGAFTVGGVLLLLSALHVRSTWKAVVVPNEFSPNGDG